MDLWCEQGGYCIIYGFKVCRVCIQLPNILRDTMGPNFSSFTKISRYTVIIMAHHNTGFLWHTTVVYSVSELTFNLFIAPLDESFRGNEEAPFSPSSLRSISPSTPPLLSPLLTAHPTHTFLRAKDSLYLPRGMPSKSTSLPNHPSPFLPVHPLFTRSHSRSPSPTLSPHTLSPTVITNGTSSPRGSPMSKAKSRFRLSGSHLKELTSPNRSPLLGRMKRWSSAASHDVNVENEFLYWWMDSTSGEVKHWQLMLERQGQWVYFWHALRANMKPAHS